jgi:hypothetical protein
VSSLFHEQLVTTGVGCAMGRRTRDPGDGNRCDEVIRTADKAAPQSGREEVCRSFLGSRNIGVAARCPVLI